MEAEVQSGVCRVCACTEEAACRLDDEGNACWWIDAGHTLCSNPACLGVVPLAQIEKEIVEAGLQPGTPP